ncbi:MAG: T9SS type A sorting domain-containing protein [Bacteroidota bacterium]
MNRAYLVVIALVFLFPSFLKAQKGRVVWERGGEISASSFSFSPDSSEFIVSDRSSEISIRNTETGLVVRTFKLQSSNYRVSWAPTGNRLAVLTHKYIGNDSRPAMLLLDAGDGRILQEIVPYYGDIAFSPDGNYLYRSEYQGGGTIVELQDTIVRIFNFPWDRFAILPGDTTAIVWEKDSLHLVSFPKGERIIKYSELGQVWESDIEFLTIDRVNIRAAVVTNGNRFLKVFDFKTGEVIQQWPVTSGVGQLAFSPDGITLAAAEYSSFKFLDITSGELISEEQISTHQNGFIRFASSGKVIFIGAYSGSGDCLPDNYDRAMEPEPKLFIWNSEKHERIIPERQGHHTKILTIRFSDDSKTIVTVDSDSLALTWDTPTGTLLKREKVSEFPSTQFTTISPTGKYKLVSGAYDFELWDNSTNKLISSLPYFKQMTSVYGRTFSPDEQYILASIEYYYMGAGSGPFPPQELHIWNVTAGRKHDSIVIPCFLSHIQVSGDNQYIAGVTFDGRVIVLNGMGLLTSVENSFAGVLLKTSIYPNPLQESGTIFYSVLKPEVLKISIHDIFGRELVVLKNEFTEPGNYTFPFKSSNLSNGMYFLKTTNGTESGMVRFIILQ